MYNIIWMKKACIITWRKFSCVYVGGGAHYMQYCQC